MSCVTFPRTKYNKYKTWVRQSSGFDNDGIVVILSLYIFGYRMNVYRATRKKTTEEAICKSRTQFDTAYSTGKSRTSARVWNAYVGLQHTVGIRT